MLKYLRILLLNYINMFTKSIEDMSLSWLVKYITETYHEPLRKNLIKLDWLVDSIIKDYIKDYPDLVSLQELYNQFRSEISKHVIKEEFVVFPSIIKFEAIYNDAFIDLTLNHEMIEKLVNDVEMKNQHIEFDLYLSSIIQLLEWSNINNKWIKDFDNAKAIFISIQQDNITHAKLENEDLYLKWRVLQNKIKEKLDNIWKK